jgi:hypothetical protein
MTEYDNIAAQEHAAKHAGAFIILLRQKNAFIGRAFGFYASINHTRLRYR